MNLDTIYVDIVVSNKMHSCSSCRAGNLDLQFLLFGHTPQLRVICYTDNIIQSIGLWKKKSSPAKKHTHTNRRTRQHCSRVCGFYTSLSLVGIYLILEIWVTDCKTTTQPKFSIRPGYNIRVFKSSRLRCYHSVTRFHFFFFFFFGHRWSMHLLVKFVVVYYDSVDLFEDPLKKNYGVV